ncbi:Pectinesterase inhibitor domain [Macleaya cordata]|uniref:Pectinesterase inhibitor domain n=1 Tax=Macleaya cordata TaxID=56857 RepID=A0A200PLU5_MACCD|nr:Pectinesterase inhibitor domain [Macleaya cordata]
MCPPFSLIFLSFFVLLFHGGFGVDLIEETCRKSVQTDPNLSYNFCLTSLQAVPKSHTSDLKGLGLISINLTKTNATHTNLYIKKLLNQKQISQYCKIRLIDCLDLYSDAIISLKNAIKDFTSRHNFEANIEVSAAMDASTTCEDGFDEMKKCSEASPLTKRNNDMFQLAAISLAIINMVG